MLNQQKKLTVTVGISAYNEQENILYAIKSILRQRNTSFELEKIIVISDGSTDSTVKKVSNYRKKYHKIFLINENIRRGKKTRLTQIFNLNKSDIIVIFDADIILGNSNVIENMIKHFRHRKVELVGGSIFPIASSNFASKVIAAWYEYRHETLKDLNKGNNIHNLHGCAIAMRKVYAKKIKFPKEIISEAQYLYCFSKKFNKRIIVDIKSAIFFRIPDNLKEYFFKNRRALNEKQKLEKIFGNWTQELYKIPITFKIKSLIKMSLLNPIYFLFAILFFFINKIIPKRRDISAENGFWKTDQSTKGAIKNISF